MQFYYSKDELRRKKIIFEEVYLKDIFRKQQGWESGKLRTA